MNTYPALRSSDIPENVRNESLMEIKEILDRGNLVCVRLEDFYCGDVVLHGIYEKTPEEAEKSRKGRTKTAPVIAKVVALFSTPYRSLRK